MNETLKYIKSKGIKPSVSIKPATSIDAIKDILHLVDMILVMTVVPGLGGQALIEETLDKVKALRELEQRNPEYNYDIQVDGGIKAHTANKAISAGANILVAGSAVTGTEDYRANMDALRG